MDLYVLTKSFYDRAVSLTGASEFITRIFLKFLLSLFASTDNAWLSLQVPKDPSKMSVV